MVSEISPSSRGNQCALVLSDLRCDRTSLGSPPAKASLACRQILHVSCKRCATQGKSSMRFGVPGRGVLGHDWCIAPHFLGALVGRFTTIKARPTQ